MRQWGRYLRKLPRGSVVPRAYGKRVTQYGLHKFDGKKHREALRACEGRPVN